MKESWKNKSYMTFSKSNMIFWISRQLRGTKWSEIVVVSIRNSTNEITLIIESNRRLTSSLRIWSAKSRARTESLTFAHSSKRRWSSREMRKNNISIFCSVAHLPQLSFKMKWRGRFMWRGSVILSSLYVPRTISSKIIVQTYKLTTPMCAMSDSEYLATMGRSARLLMAFTEFSFEAEFIRA